MGYPLKNVDDFFLIDDNYKKECYFNILKESITILAIANEWDFEPLEKTFHQIKESQYNNYWTYGRAKRSPNKLYTVELFIEHDISELRFYILIRNNEGGILKKKLMYKEEPRECYYSKHCGKLIWISDDAISINDKVWTIF